jgi:predicted nucleotidyltransferase
MTWIRFLKIRTWAQTLADELKAPVYLVGSVLDKDIPRDIDISVIFPVKIYEERFGVLPKDKVALGEQMEKMHLNHIRLKAYFEIMSAIEGNDPK